MGRAYPASSHCVFKNQNFVVPRAPYVRNGVGKDEQERRAGA